MRETVKKWWVLVLVATLALSLTSCGKKQKNYLLSGGIQCGGEGAIGDFDVAAVSTGNPNQLELIVVPYSAYADTFDFWLKQTTSESSAATHIGQIAVGTESQEYPLGIFSKTTLLQNPWLEIRDPVSQEFVNCRIPTN